MNRTLDIVIVSYNVRYQLEQCLRSVERASQGIDVNIWVVDNASSDGTIPYLRDRFPSVHYIENKDNAGFSRANNQGIRFGKGSYVLLLNPDTIVGEDVLRGCLQFLEEHPEVGATGVRMLHPNGSFAPESRRGLPTPFTSFCKMTGLSTLFPKSKWFGRYYMRYLNTEEPNPIEVISGAFCMVRRKALDNIGLLDEQFFMYGEDIDLSYRLLQAGWKNYYLPLTILHYKGESTVKSTFRYVHVFYNSMLIFFNKHYSSQYRFLGFFIKVAVYLRALLDMYIRMWDKMCLRIGWHSTPPPIRYIRFNFDTMSAHEILETLRMQPHKERQVIETVSKKTGMIIRPGEIKPLAEESAFPLTDTAEE